LASPHWLLRKPYDETPRLVRAVEQPGVHVVGHPRGRMYSRPGIVADWPTRIHSSSLKDVEFGLAAARLAGIPADRVINCWDDERLNDWLARRRR
jgi:histidinol phosphatase-like PHP family hydrolase